MSEEAVPLEMRQMDRYRASLDAWFDLRGGFRCPCGGAAWSFRGYQLVSFDQFGGPTGDSHRAGGYVAGHVSCQQCCRVVLYDLTHIESGVPLEGGDGGDGAMG